MSCSRNSTHLSNLHDSSEYSKSRVLLRRAWNTTYTRDLGTNKLAATPFRAVMNAGDLLGRKYYSCGGSNQAPQSRPGVKGIRSKLGSIHSLCDNTNVPAAYCNSKFVYDSSDYVTYVRHRAENRNYGDTSFGGNDHSAAQSALRSVMGR